jgi:LDH2 family malate/lactate/ureidoglycolate dehydrogenase
MKVSLGALKHTVLAVLNRSGYPSDEAETILDVLLYAQLRGNNQGVVKLIGAGLPRDPCTVSIRTIRETKLSALLDGGWNVGIVVMQAATHLAIEKCRHHGMSLVGTQRTASSTGAIGYYARRIAEAGFIGLVFAGSGEYVAMQGSYEPLFGTNPLAIGIPTAAQPLVLDMATSAIARYGIIEAQTAGRSLPPDVAYDADGQPTTDPSAALAGAIRTFGGHKGAGLALMVEILTRPLVAATYSADGRKLDWGNLVIAFDPELLVDAESFKQDASDLIQRVKATLRLPGVDAILVPGERGDHLMQAALESGSIEIDDGLWQALLQAAHPNPKE